MFYSKSTNGFYLKEIHSNIPTDAVEITTEEHAALLQGQSEGRLIVANDSGYPVLIDKPSPTVEEQANTVRFIRDGLLDDTTWLVDRHLEQTQAGSNITLTAEQFKSLLEYRQQLRDIPVQPGFPTSVVWPVCPVATK